MKKEDRTIADKIFSLDNVRPETTWNEEDLWQHLEKKMHLKRKVERIMYAATFTGLLISLSLTFYYSRNNTSMIEHTTESIDLTSNQANDLHDLEASAVEFILASCKTGMDICKSEEFKALTAELNTLELEIASLENMMATYGDDPLFVKSKIQIENHKSEIMGKLVQMILS